MARTNINKYDPTTDSSAGHEKYRPGGFEGVVLISTTPTETAPATCPSGCGRPVSPKRTFSQGGDAKLKGILQRAAATDTPVRQIVDGKQAKETDPVKIAGQYGFQGQVSAFVDRAKAEAAEASERRAAREAKAAELAERRVAKQAEREKAREARERTKAAKAAAKAAAPAKKASARKAAPAKKAAGQKSAAQALAESKAS